MATQSRHILAKTVLRSDERPVTGEGRDSASLIHAVYRFDIVRTFDRRDGGRRKFGQEPQLLLAGDIDELRQHRTECL
jgi:hypothetical protein